MNIMDEEEKKEQIRAAVSKLPDEVVRDALVLSLLGQSAQSVTAEERNLETEGFQNIFDLVTYLKRTYTFPELNHLVIEGGKLFFKDGDRRIMIGEQSYDNPNQAITPASKPQVTRHEAGKNYQPSKNESERFSRIEFDD
ncbi:MAG: hypothetical protein JXR70_00290 [Spirochaetales bacterium]|nr:hypothetical protein [Spirochaetales bacterium]